MLDKLQQTVYTVKRTLVQTKTKLKKGFKMDTKKTNKSNKKSVKKAAVSMAMLFVVASVVFSSYVVYFGTTGLVPKIMLVPQVAFAAGVLVHKFVK